MEKSENYFNKLKSIDVSRHIETRTVINKKTGRRADLKYISWANSWSILKSVYPDAEFKVHENEQGLPFIKFDQGVFVKVTVIIEKNSHTQFLAVRNLYTGEAIQAPTSTEINSTIQRCLAKCIALHGIGLDLYSKEDIPPLQENSSNGSYSSSHTISGNGNTESQAVTSKSSSDVTGNKPSPETTVKKCPKCNVGEIVLKTARESGRSFYACNNFPACKNIVSSV